MYMYKSCQSEQNASQFSRGKLECDLLQSVWRTKQTHPQPNQHDRLSTHQQDKLLGLVQKKTFEDSPHLCQAELVNTEIRSWGEESCGSVVHEAKNDRLPGLKLPGSSTKLPHCESRRTSDLCLLTLEVPEFHNYQNGHGGHFDR